jgi:catechol 2,3-dioxygenase-like lactoylglutathione lyase family enzyme
MIDRLDHVVVVVADLESAITRYRRAGFHVQPGGRHPDRGTENAIIRFGLTYLELLAVWDPARAEARGPFGQTIVDALAARPTGGLLGYVLATHDIKEEAARLRAADIPFDGPFAMQRERPDGNRLVWQLLVPHGTPWRRPWPMIIEWGTPDGERLGWEPVVEHRNGASGFSRLDVLARETSRTEELLERGLGLSPVRDQGGRAAGFRVDGAGIRVVSADDERRRQILETFGEGVDRVWLTSSRDDVRLHGEPWRHGIRFDRPAAGWLRTDVR